MKKIQTLKNWGIYELNDKEKVEYDFNFAVIHPDVMGTGPLTPNDTDWECYTLDEAISWIDNYDKPAKKSKKYPNCYDGCDGEDCICCEIYHDNQY